MEKAPVESFPALSAIPGLIHGFTLRVPGLDVKVDRDAALARLDEYHASSREALGLADKRFIYAKQVHGAEVALVDASTPVPVEGVDGLLTADPQAALGIYVADCCPVYLVCPVKRVVGLLHSGRKGSELGIGRVAIETMVRSYGCNPADVVAQLGPCIRPPHYEVEFSAKIVADLRSAGVQQVHDCETCTACEPERYYSYRMELGKTGRMLALIAWA